MIFRNDIQILRGFSVLLVLFYHFQFDFFKNGFLGVDLFFVISGYLMAQLYSETNGVGFYVRRLKRLLPAYLIVIIATVSVAVFLTLPSDFLQVIDQVNFNIFFSGNFFYWNKNSYFSNVAFNPLLNLWSLGVEVQFYILIPFLFPYIRKNIFLFSFVFSTSFIICMLISLVSPKTSFFMMPLRIWQFLLGAFIFWYVEPYFNTTKKYYSFLVLSFLIPIFIIIFFVDIKIYEQNIFTGHPSFLTMAVSLLFSLVLLFKIPEIWCESRLGKFLKQLGNLSYSIYLVHFPIIILYNYEPFRGTILGYATYFDLFLMLILIVTASLASYFFVERGRLFSQNFLAKTITLILITLLSVSALSGLNAYGYTDKQMTIFAASTDRSIYRCGKIFRILNPFERVCKITEGEGTQKLLLIGDSHADSIKTQFGEIAQNLSSDLYFYVRNDSLSEEEDISTIVSDIIQLKIDKITVHYSNIYKNTKKTKLMEALIKEILIMNIPIYLIAPIPTYAVHVPRAMYYETMETENRNMLVSKNQHIERVKHVKRVSDFWQMAQKFDSDKVKIQDPFYYLCDDSKCRYSDTDGSVFYFDSNHLTLSGSRQLAPIFEKIVKEN